MQHVQRMVAQTRERSSVVELDRTTVNQIIRKGKRNRKLVWYNCSCSNSGWLIPLRAAWWKIFSKAGYTGASGLLMLIPFVGIIVLLIFAFSKWPLHKILRYLNIKEVPSTDFDKAMKKAVKLEVLVFLKEAREEYQRIIDDAQSCRDVIDKNLQEIERQHNIV